ncbi:MAG TPA: SIR2 family protein [Pyrinomonadaceae bacterium]
MRRANCAARRSLILARRQKGGRDFFMLDPLDLHYRMVVKAITDGRVVPLLGAGVNMTGRPPGSAFQLGGRYLPSGYELARMLADTFGYTPDMGQVKCPNCGTEHPVEYPLDLLRVSEYVALMTGSGALYDELRRLFNADYPPTILHEFLAAAPGLLRSKNLPPRYQLIVTTNYDDVLERAFRAAGEEYDLVAYVAEGDSRGKFWHWPPGDEARLVEKPNEYLALNPEQRTVILKIHGAVDRLDAEKDSYVITEDHYIDFLTRTDISNLLPVRLAMKLRQSHFLFLGYSLRDWNLRVILHRIWGEQKLKYKSWAIQLNPPELDRQFWLRRDVDILNVRLEDYITALRRRVEALPPAAPAAGGA